jgi:hypothetical protein
VCKTVSNMFQANAKQSGRTKFLGKFATAEEAARAYDRFKREHGTPADKLNFADKANGAGSAGSAEAPGGKRKRIVLSAASSDADDEDAGEEQHSTHAAPSPSESETPLPDALPASASGAELVATRERNAALEAQLAALQSSEAARTQLAAQLAATQARAAALEAELARMRRDAARSTRSARNRVTI